MKTYIIIWICVFSAFALSGQNLDKISADEHFERLEYAYAAQDYLEELREGKSSERTYVRLGICYEKMANYQQAERYYRRVAKGRNAQPDLIYAYAQMLKANDKYDDYTKEMNRFTKAAPQDARAKKYKAQLEDLKNITAQEPLFTLETVSFNSKKSDFGAVQYGDSIYFSSSREFMKHNHGWTDQAFLDIYVARVSKDGKVNNPNLLSSIVNTKYHEGIIARTKNGNRIYFDRNNYTNKKYKKDSTGINQLQLYYSDFNNGVYGEAVPLPFNDKNYSTGHPALSPDGRTLYFVSDRPGGYGKADIWKASILEDGSFGTPENLGDNINTTERETFPHLVADGTLYFSSDGHVGLGGLDIFGYDGKEIQNLGSPINTGADDFSFKPNLDGTTGYMASNRKRKGDDDIYAFTKIPPCTAPVSITIRDEKRKPIENGTFVLIDDTDRTEQKLTTNTFGQYTFTSDCNKTYTIKTTAEGFDPVLQGIKVLKDRVREQVTVQTTLDVEVTEDRVVLNPIYFDFDKWDITPQAAQELDRLVAVMQRYPSMIISAESHTDARGNDTYNLSLSDKRAKSMRDYVISRGIASNRISGIGKGETDPAVDCGLNCSEEEHQLNRRSEFVIIKK